MTLNEVVVVLSDDIVMLNEVIVMLKVRERESERESALGVRIQRGATRSRSSPGRRS